MTGGDRRLIMNGLSSLNPAEFLPLLAVWRIVGSVSETRDHPTAQRTRKVANMSHKPRLSLRQQFADAHFIIVSYAVLALVYVFAGSVRLGELTSGRIRSQKEATMSKPLSK